VVEGASCRLTRRVVVTEINLVGRWDNHFVLVLDCAVGAFDSSAEFASVHA